MSILLEMKEYAARGGKRWHTPGHKGELAALDLTEIDCESGRIFPSDSVVKAQEKAAEFYSAKYCRFLVGGSSGGIKAAIMSAGGDIIVPKARHRCVDEGAALARCKVFEAECDRSADGIYAPPTSLQIEAAMDKYPTAKAAVIVSPDYYGTTAERETADAVHARGKILIADSAHGAHFAARKDLFGEGFSALADICVMSAHKTMRAYTQSSYLCCNDSSLMKKVDGNLRLLGTTSPSYLLLSSLEEAVDHARKNAAHYDELKAALDGFRKKIACRKSDDFTRLVVDANRYGMSGKEMFDKLYSLGHVAEAYDERYVIFIVTLSDKKRDVEELCRAVKRSADER